MRPQTDEENAAVEFAADEDDGDETHQRATNEGGAGQHHLQQQQRKKMGQSSMENWTKSGTLNIDGRLKPLVRETMPSSLSSLGGQKKMIMVEESPKKKKLKTMVQPTTMKATPANPAWINRGMAAMKVQPSSSSSFPSQTPPSSSPPSSADDDGWLEMMLEETREALQETANMSTTDTDSPDSLLSTITNASSFEREYLLRVLTRHDPLQLEYLFEELVSFLTMATKMDDVIHPEQHIESKWDDYVKEKAEYHRRIEDVHLKHSCFIKGKIAAELMSKYSSEDVEDDGNFIVENTHFFILIQKDAPANTITVPTCGYTSTMKDIGFGRIVEATILNVGIAGLNQQGELKSDLTRGSCATKCVLFDLFYSAAHEGIFKVHEKAEFALFSFSDLLPSIGPEFSKPDNTGYIPAREVFRVHVQADPKKSYAGIKGAVVLETCCSSAQEIAQICREHNIFIIPHSAKLRDVLARTEYRERLTLWRERTLAYSCAPCCHAVGGRWSFTSINALSMSIAMRKSGHEDHALVSLFDQGDGGKSSAAGSETFQVFRNLIRRRSGVTEDRLQQVMTICIERVCTHAAELSVDLEKPIETFKDLHLAFSYIGGINNKKFTNTRCCVWCGETKTLVPTSWYRPFDRLGSRACNEGHICGACNRKGQAALQKKRCCICQITSTSQWHVSKDDKRKGQDICASCYTSEVNLLKTDKTCEKCNVTSSTGWYKSKETLDGWYCKKCYDKARPPRVRK
ncbi:unnamed protein product [Bathycoccus prasinos]